MNQNELDVLLQKNEHRIDEIKARYLQKCEKIKSYQELLIEQKESFETKQKFKDNSLAYPSYGRGLIPHREMNTFMIQENLAGSPDAARRLADGKEMSPQACV